MNSIFKTNQIFHGLLLICTMFVCYLIYLPGIQGDFLFDDFTNLSPLGIHGTINNIDKAMEFILSGFSGPTGRPVSLLTFLLNDNTWPSNNNSSFKLTNILFHLTNGLLIYWITLLLNKQVVNNKHITSQSMWIALLTSTVWVFHPYLVSTVLYIVQRMTILMTFFALISIIFYLKGRLIANSHNRLSILLILISYLVFIPLSIFSKENGALTPLFILLIEMFFFRQNKINNRTQSFILKTIIYGSSIGTLLILLYYLINVVFGHNAYSNRDFSISERLLTESRVLFIYIYNWLAPHIQTAGLYNDSIQISKNLFTPITTLFSLIGHSIIITMSIKKRHHYPVISFSILFFYLAHLMESTFIPLELFFEHRNYLATIFLFYPVAYYLVVKANSPLKQIITVLIFLILLTTLNLRVNIWKDTDNAKLIWAAQAPYSLRAQLDIARYFLFKGKLSKSLYYTEQAIKHNPDNPKPLIFNEIIYCINREVPVSYERIDEIKHAMSKSAFHISLYEYLNYLVKLKDTKKCSNINYTQLIDIIDTSLNTYPYLSKNIKSIFLELKGTALLYNKKPKQALDIFIHELNSVSNINNSMSNIAELANKGYYEEALILLSATEEKVSEISNQGKHHINYEKELIRLKATLLDEKKHVRNGN